MDSEADRPSEQSSGSSGTRDGLHRERFSGALEVAAVVIFIIAATAFAIITPPGGGPDEDGHAVYARALSHGRMPRPAPATEIHAGAGGEVIYDCAQAHHPPLYYAIVGGLHALTGHQDGLLTPIGRTLNILAGIAALLLIRAAMHRAFPDRSLAIAAGLGIAAASVSFTYVMGSFTNDPLAVLATCAAIYLAVRALQSPRPMRWLLALGGALGVGLLAKLTAAVIVIPLLVAGLGVARREAPDAWRRAAWGTAAALGIAAVLVGPWLARNYLLVGVPTFNCAPRPPLFESSADLIIEPVATVLATALGLEEAIAGAWWPEWLLRDHHTLTADIFVGGGLTPDTRPAWMLLLPLAVGALGFAGVIGQMRGRGRVEPDASGRSVLWILILIPVMATAGILHQALLVDGHILRWAGRYVSVLIPAASMAIALGLDGWRPGRWRIALPIAAILTAVALNGWAALRVMRIYEGWL